MSKASLQVKVITYNTHLFYKTIVPYVHQDSQRLSGIINKFKQEDVDIICLNEVWSDEIKEEFTTKLVDYYYYNHYFNDRSLLSFEPDNGLLTLSKSRLDPQHSLFQRYVDLKDWDCKARKGILQSYVLVKHDDNEYVPCYVFATHTQAGNQDLCEKNLKQLRDLVNKIAWGYYPVFILGDLNTTAEDHGTHYLTNAYRNLMNLFAPLGFQDAYRSIYPDAAEHPGYTTDWYNNKLYQIFNPSDKSQKRIDYILVNQFINLNESQIEIPEDYLYEGTDDQGKLGEIDLSDHYPLKATFCLSWGQ